MATHKTNRQENSIKRAYHGYVASNLRYGVLLWGNSVLINRAFIAQKQCIRAISDVPPLASCRPLFVELNLLTLPGIYIFEVSTFVKRNINLFTQKKNVCNFNTRYPDRLVLPNSKTYICNRNAYAMCVKVYNNLPNDLRILAINKFRNALFKWLTEKCFYTVNDYLQNKY